MGKSMDLSVEAIRAKLVDFIVGNFLFGDSSKAPSDSVSFMGSGIMDSTGILELLEFLEESFDIKVSEQETVPQNLDSVENLVRFVSAKLVA